MRLSVDQTRLILRCVRQQFGADAGVKLFGSRLDDSARGGDVDLLVETQGPPTLRQRALATLANANPTFCYEQAGEIFARLFVEGGFEVGPRRLGRLPR